MDMKQVEEWKGDIMGALEENASSVDDVHKRMEQVECMYLIIKQQQELLEQLVGEETLHQSGEYETEMKRLHDKVVRYQEALRFYADRENWHVPQEPFARPSKVSVDLGERAQQALDE